MAGTTAAVSARLHAVAVSLRDCDRLGISAKSRGRSQLGVGQQRGLRNIVVVALISSHLIQWVTWLLAADTAPQYSFEPASHTLGKGNKQDGVGESLP